MNVQWYPGHMTKAKRQMQEDIKLIDLIIELVDARVPLSSRNPDIDELGKNKSRLILLNKSDLADERQNEAWKTYFQAKGFYVVKVDSRNGSGMKAINNVIQEACKEKIERDRRRGIKNRPIRADGDYVRILRGHLHGMMELLPWTENEIWKMIPDDDSPLFWLIEKTGCVLTDYNNSIGMKMTPAQQTVFDMMRKHGVLTDDYYDLTKQREKVREAREQKENRKQ